MHRSSRLLSLGAILCAACSDDDSTGSAAAPKPEPPSGETPLPVTLKAIPCRYLVPKSVEGKDFWCGDLDVPGNRLHVIVFKGKANGTTTLMLEGGPGGSAEPSATGLAMKDPISLERFDPYRGLGDVVFFDQRGVGRSVPRLTCVPESNTSDPDPAKTCFERLEKAGVDFATYDSAHSADDVAALATALGQRRVNLHGISYGTRLALEVLRRHPDLVRGAVIDGVAPPQSKVFTDMIPNFDATITKSFLACAADAKCNATYPDLEKAFADLKTKLDATPFTASGFALDWDTLVGNVFDTLYDPGAAGQLPFFVTTLLKQSQSEWQADQAQQSAKYQAEQKTREDALRATPLGKEVYARLDGPEGDLHYEIADDLTFGMFAAVNCSDSGQYESREDALAALSTIRESLRVFGEQTVRSSFAGCRTLPKVAPKSNATAPIRSSVPTIVVSGGFDPATPPKDGDLAAATLTNHQLVLVPGGAHGQQDKCTIGVKVKYLDTLEPVDASCATSRQIDFYYGTEMKTLRARPRHAPHR